MPEIEILGQLGLPEAEAKVYLALLETGSTLAGAVIKKTGLHRGTTYQVLQRLIEKGLVNFVIKSGKRYFGAADPSRFLDILKEKQEIFNSILPSLKQKKELSKEKQEAHVYAGIRGIRSVMDSIIDELNPAGEYLDFGASGLFREVMGPYWDLWQKKKRTCRIKSKVIFNELLKNENPHLLKDYCGEARFHPKEYSSLTDTIIYKDAVALFVWTAKPPLAIVIKNKDNAESYKNQFRLMWRMAKK